MLANKASLSPVAKFKSSIAGYSYLARCTGSYAYHPRVYDDMNMFQPSRFVQKTPPVLGMTDFPGSHAPVRAGRKFP